MTEQRAHAWGAAMIAAGGLLGVTAALWAGRPGSLWRPLVIGLTGYAATGVLVLRWGLDVYGPRGALGAVALAAFTPCVLAALAAPPLVSPAGGTTLLGGFAQLAAAYALMRCLLDPAFQWALVAGVAIATVPVGAFLHGSPVAPLAGLAVFSLLLVVARTLTAERLEARARVAQASAVSVGLAWAVAGAIVLVVAAASHLPSAGEYSDATRPAAPAGLGADIIAVADAASTDVAPSAPARAAGLSSLPLAALLLAFARPWRRQRRYTDIGWLAALCCFGVPLWVAWGEPGGVFMSPVAALLAGACWDKSRPKWARRAAALVVGVQVAVAVLLWPHYPGGVRPDAWLPMPGIAALSRGETP